VVVIHETFVELNVFSPPSSQLFFNSDQWFW
jgi:hypothetical protein